MNSRYFSTTLPEGKKLETGTKLFAMARKATNKVGKVYGTVTSLASDPAGTISSAIQSKVEEALAMDEYEVGGWVNG